MITKHDSCASDLGSIPGQVNFLENFILLNSSKIRTDLIKKTQMTLTRPISCTLIIHIAILSIDKITMPGMVPPHHSNTIGRSDILVSIK